MAEQQGKRQGEGRQGEQGLATRQYQDPLALFDWMFERMQRELFGASLFGAMLPGRPAEGEGGTQRVPRVQMRDTSDALVLTAELPGIEPKDVQIELDGDVLTIRAETRVQEEIEGARVERAAAFYRQVRLPDGIDPEQAEASYRNGVLAIRFPRQAERGNVRQIPIDTESGEPPARARERAA
jgi:HSP20 family protein